MSSEVVSTHPVESSPSHAQRQRSKRCKEGKQIRSCTDELASVGSWGDRNRCAAWTTLLFPRFGQLAIAPIRRIEKPISGSASGLGGGSDHPKCLSSCRRAGCRVLSIPRDATQGADMVHDLSALPKGRGNLITRGARFPFLVSMPLRKQPFRFLLSMICPC